MDFLNEIEAMLPVTQWLVDGLHVWPIVRERLFWCYNADLAATRARAGSESILRRRVDRATHLVRDLSGWAAARALDGAHHARLDQQADVVLLGDNVSRILLEDRWFDRLCEPYVDILDDLGLSSLHLEPHHLYRRPRNRPSHHIQPTLDALWVAARLDRRPAHAALDAYPQLLEQVQRRGLDPSPVDRSYVIAAGRQVRRTAGWFGSLLTRTQARLGMLVDYNLQSMAFAAACRARGIPAVEIQHGSQGELHWAYGRWRSVPAAGYELLPSVYWTWSETEANFINEWSASTNGRHRAIAGGNLWLRTWLDSSHQMVQRHDEWLRPPVGVTATMLWTLQPGLSDDHQLALLRAAVRASPDGWRWWLRLHPTMTEKERQQVNEHVSTIGRRVELDEPSVLPLYALLRATNVHVTHSSSTVVEAAEFGVRSVLTSDQGGALFPHAIADGTATVATTPHVLVASIVGHIARQEQGARPTRAHSEPRPDLILRALVSAPR